MASPVDAARQGTNISTASTSWAVNVGSPTAGTLLVVLARFAAAPGAITFTGYTPLTSDSSDATDDTTAIYYRWADGTEGATDTLAPTNSVKGCTLSWKITGAAHPSLQVPEFSTVAVGTTTANSANPGSRSVTGGPKDVLYLAMMGLDGELNAPTASPTNYSAITTANSGTGGAVATNCSIGGGSRAITGSSSDDPGAFTHAAATTGWTAYTVVVHPRIDWQKTGAVVAGAVLAGASQYVPGEAPPIRGVAPYLPGGWESPDPQGWSP